MTQDEDEEGLDAFFEIPGSRMYDPAPPATTGPPMTPEQLERWAESANRFLNGSPNRVRTRPRYPNSASPARTRWFEGSILG